MSTSYMTPAYYEVLYYQASNVDSYWLASRCVDINSSNAIFYLFYVSGGTVDANYLYYSDDDNGSRSYAVRPVVEIDRTSVIIGETGSGTRTSPYSIVAK